MPGFHTDDTSRPTVTKASKTPKAASVLKSATTRKTRTPGPMRQRESVTPLGPKVLPPKVPNPYLPPRPIAPMSSFVPLHEYNTSQYTY